VIKLDKRVVLSFGGKGGTGKSTFMVSVAEWFDRQEIPYTLLDLDTENKNRGSLSHFFNGSAPKINIRTQAGLDAFVDYLDRGPAVILADMGAGSGQVTYDWFDTMHDCVRDLGIGFTGVGVVTDDPASVESLLTWASHLQERVSYLVVQNAQTEVSAFTYWRRAAKRRNSAKRFPLPLSQWISHRGTGKRLPESRRYSRASGRPKDRRGRSNKNFSYPQGASVSETAIR